MTSEVVAMNRMGIALAADSVASIYVNGEHRKRHDSVAKLFMLSERHPVGIMVYNNASLLGVPWETIIKLFRKSLEDTSFGTLEEYGRKFLAFLEKQDKLFPEGVQQRYFNIEFESECHRMLADCNNLYDQVPLARRTGADSATKARGVIVENVIRERLRKWNAEGDSVRFTRELATAYIGKMSGEIDRVIMTIFAGWPVVCTEVNRLTEIARHMIFKRNLDPVAYTGLVIGGFGEQEHFPVVQHFVVNGIYEGILKCERSRIVGISEDTPSYIESFAETKAVNDFLTGVSDQVRNEIVAKARMTGHALTEAFQFAENMEEENRAELIGIVERMSVDRLMNLEDRIDLLVRERFGAVLDVVEMLPLKELAQVASTLVRLSSFEKQLSFEVETVGEPIDVAVISKGDGFIWINRKHYFQAGLNHRYFGNRQQFKNARKEDDDDKDRGNR